MSVVTRGIKNAFRSGVRTTAVVLILAISMGLGLSMLLANQAVNNRIETVKSEVGTSIAINPAGFRGFQGGGDPLTTDDIAKVQNLNHVSSVDMTLNIIAQTAGSGGGGAVFAVGGGQKTGETSLEASAKPGVIGERLQKRGGSVMKFEGGVSVSAEGPGGAAPMDFKLPVRFVGITGARNESGQAIKLSEGRQLKSDDRNVAVVGKALAEKNSLKLGSTFMLYGETFSVVGIFNEGTEFGNDAAYIPLATAQRVSEADKEIGNAVVKVDSVDNLEATAKKIASVLGTDKADVTVAEENALTAVESLRSVERVSMIGFIIALGAAAVVTLLTMVMIVRERRREIGVLKALGGSNRVIVSQFVVEALVLVLISATVGMGIAAASGNSIAGALVKSNTSETTSDSNEPFVTSGGPGGGGFQSVRIGGGAASIDTAKDLVGNITTNVGVSSLGYGLLAAVFIAVVGSALPAWLVTKVRPAEVLRGE